MKKIKFILFGCLYLISHFADAMEIGVGLHPQTFPDTSQNLIELLKKNNISTFRTDYFWSQVEKKKGLYQPINGKIEETIKLAKQNKIKPLIIYGYGNSLYPKNGFDSLNGSPISEDVIKHFVNYVRWSTVHLKNNVSMFEIWNEWIQGQGNKGKFLATSDSSAKLYADLVIQSCKAIKEVNPDAMVIAGSISPLDNDSRKWLLNVIDHEILNCVDGISLHPYDYNVNKKLDYDRIISSLQTLQLQVKAVNNGKSVPFYITETGIPNVSQAFYSLQDTANYFTKYMQALSKLNYVKGVWWYDFINDGNNPDNKEHNFGILNRDFSPKPIARIFPQVIKKYDQ